MFEDIYEMATRYWYGVILKPIDRALADLGLSGLATIGGSVTSQEVLSIDFASPLSKDDEDVLSKNLNTMGYKLERIETV